MNTKQFFILMLAVVLLAGCAVSYLAPKAAPQEAAPTESTDPEPTDNGGEEETSANAQAILDALARGRDAYAPDTVVLTVDGEPVTWDMYFYNTADELMTAIYYMGGFPESFDMQLTEDLTMEQYLRQSAMTKGEYYAIGHSKAAGKGLTLSAEAEERIAEYWQRMTEQYGSEEALQDALAENYMTRDMLQYMIESNELLNALLENAYGADGEKLSDEEIAFWAGEEGYIHVKHILYPTFGQLGATLDEDAKAERKQQAEASLAELQGLLEDAEALEKRFDELMHADTGDEGGLARFPGGYTFTQGTMYPVFEEAAFALKEYGLSELVESESGYHIILRLPLRAEELTMDQDSNTGEYMTLRRTAANTMFSKDLAGWIRDAQVEWAPGFEDLDLDALFAYQAPAPTQEP